MLLEELKAKLAKRGFPMAEPEKKENINDLNLAPAVITGSIQEKARAIEMQLAGTANRSNESPTTAKPIETIAVMQCADVGEKETKLGSNQQRLLEGPIVTNCLPKLDFPLPAECSEEQLVPPYLPLPPLAPPPPLTPIYQANAERTTQTLDQKVEKQATERKELQTAEKSIELLQLSKKADQPASPPSKPSQFWEGFGILPARQLKLNVKAVTDSPSPQKQPKILPSAKLIPPIAAEVSCDENLPEEPAKLVKPQCKPPLYPSSQQAPIARTNNLLNPSNCQTQGRQMFPARAQQSISIPKSTPKDLLAVQQQRVHRPIFDQNLRVSRERVPLAVHQDNQQLRKSSNSSNGIVSANQKYYQLRPNSTDCKQLAQMNNAACIVPRVSPYQPRVLGPAQPLNVQMQNPFTLNLNKLIGVEPGNQNNANADSYRNRSVDKAVTPSYNLPVQPQKIGQPKISNTSIILRLFQKDAQVYLKNEFFRTHPALSVLRQIPPYRKDRDYFFLSAQLKPKNVNQLIWFANGSNVTAFYEDFTKPQEAQEVVGKHIERLHSFRKKLKASNWAVQSTDLGVFGDLLVGILVPCHDITFDYTAIAQGHKTLKYGLIPHFKKLNDTKSVQIATDMLEKLSKARTEYMGYSYPKQLAFKPEIEKILAQVLKGK